MFTASIMSNLVIKPARGVAKDTVVKNTKETALETSLWSAAYVCCHRPVGPQH